MFKKILLIQPPYTFEKDLPEIVEYSNIAKTASCRSNESCRNFKKETGWRVKW